MTATPINTNKIPYEEIQSRYAQPGYPWNSSTSILSGLLTRELHGNIRRSDPIAPGSSPQIYDPFVWSTDYLASVAAWNPKRLQNIILAVGPGTPASFALSSMDAENDDSSEFSQTVSILIDDDDDDDDGDNSNEDEECRGDTRSIFIDCTSSTVLKLSQSLRRIDEHKDEEEDEDDSCDEISGEVEHDTSWEVTTTADNQSSNDQLLDSAPALEAFNLNRSKRIRRTRMREDYGTDTSVLNSEIQSKQSQTSSYHQNDKADTYKPSLRSRLYDSPSMRHDGCINTAVWLSGSWRLSMAHTEENYSHSNSFIHSSSQSSNANSGPRVNGQPVNTMDNEYETQIITSGDDRLVKFWDVSHSMGSAYPDTCFTPFSTTYPADGIEPSVVKGWKKKYRHGCRLPGLVQPLASIKTGHRGNIFHVTPVVETPGKVLTCGADGFLLLSDIEQQSSISSSWTTSSVVVSPHINDNIHLGNASLLGLGEMSYSHVMMDSNTGLLCGSEGLHRYDLRLSSHSQPARSILGTTPCKACALLPLSDAFRRTYLTDSVYFFAGGSGPAVHLYDLRYISGYNCKIIESCTPRKLGDGSSVSVSGIDVSRDRRELLVSYENDVIYTFPILPAVKSAAGPSLEEKEIITLSSNTACIREIASYGAHLNRLTFLKSARYAGPNDEYICTGSDSGHAWIYDKMSGTVASLLKADKTTCNGVVPHPTLPFFLTYGIDSTAKLWRATVPVSDDVDDSENGRCVFLHRRKYQKSIVVDDWKASKANASMSFDLNDKDSLLFPDDFPVEEASTETDFMLGSFSRFILNALSSDKKVFKIRNDLHNLPLLLAQNLSTCIRANHDDDDIPIQSTLSELQQRISVMRIRYQLDQLGYPRSISLNYLGFLFKEAQKFGFPNEWNNAGDHFNLHHAMLPDLIPEHPSDWFPYDQRIVNEPVRFSNNSAGAIMNKHSHRRWRSFDSAAPPSPVTLSINGESPTNSQNAIQVISNVILLLKDYGNLALKKGEVCLAAKYYDKAIRYCSTIFIPCAHGSIKCFGDYQCIILGNGGYYTEWNSLFKIFLSTRLNLSAVLIKQEISDYECACQQAQLVIDSLKPFTTTAGKILSGPKLESFLDEEPAETYIEANTMKAKAYFRLGNAEFSMNDFSAAMRSFRNSLKAAKAAHLQPESVVLRRLDEARVACARKSG